MASKLSVQLADSTRAALVNIIGHVVRRPTLIVTTPPMIPANKGKWIKQHNGALLGCFH